MVENSKKHINDKISFHLKEWHDNNLERYNKFLEDFNAMSFSYPSMMLQFMQLISSSIPIEGMEALNYLSCLVNDGDVESPVPSFIMKHLRLVYELLVNRKAITISISSGDTVIINLDNNFVPTDDVAVVTFLELEKIREQQPELIQCYIDDLITEFNDALDDIQVESDLSPLVGTEIFLDYLDNIYNLYAMLMVPETLKNMLAKGMGQSGELPYCISYFIVFDGGMKKMENKVHEMMKQRGIGIQGYIIKKMLSRMLINRSISLGFETKNSWKEHAINEPEKHRNLINKFLSEIKENRGPKIKERNLKKLLKCKDNEIFTSLVDLIKEYKSARPDVVSYAYLFYMLRKLGIVKDREMQALCDAVDSYLGLPSKNAGKAQKRYAEIMANEDALDEKWALDHKRGKDYWLNGNIDYNSVSWKRTREIISEWLPMFSNIVQGNK